MSEDNLIKTESLPEAIPDIDLVDNDIEEDFSFDLASDASQKKEIMVQEEKNFNPTQISQPISPIEPETPLMKKKLILEEEITSSPVIENATETALISPEINEKLDSILARLDVMDQKINKVRDNADNKIMDLKGELEAVSVKSTDVPKITTQPAPVKKKAVTSQKVVKRKVSPPVRWELRSAQPGKAWVSKQGQDDVREVNVGERLSGIGRVTAITQTGGRWQISGTSGSIKQ